MCMRCDLKVCIRYAHFFCHVNLIHYLYYIHTDPALGGYPTPVDTKYVYEFAAPFLKQPGDGSVHHCAYDASDVGACPKVRRVRLSFYIHHLLYLILIYNLNEHYSYLISIFSSKTIAVRIVLPLLKSLELAMFHPLSHWLLLRMLTMLVKKISVPNGSMRRVNVVLRSPSLMN